MSLTLNISPYNKKHRASNPWNTPLTVTLAPWEQFENGLAVRTGCSEFVPVCSSDLDRTGSSSHEQNPPPQYASILLMSSSFDDISIWVRVQMGGKKSWTNQGCLFNMMSTVSIHLSEIKGMEQRTSTISNWKPTRHEFERHSRDKDRV